MPLGGPSALPWKCSALWVNLQEKSCNAWEQFLHVEQIVREPRPQDILALWRYSQRRFHSYGELWLMREDAGKVALPNPIDYQNLPAQITSWLGYVRLARSRLIPYRAR